MDEVLFIGEALIDIINVWEERVEPPGGSPANVAYGLGKLDVPVHLTTRIGTDTHGSHIARWLSSGGVSLTPGSVVEGATSTATATLRTDGSASYDFDIDWTISPNSPLAQPALVHTGSIAAFLEPGGSQVRELITSLDRTIPVTFDPNIRPSIIGNRRRAREAFEEWLELCDLVKLSDEDAQWLNPDEQSSDIVSRILDRGVIVVALTLGSTGSVLATDRQTVEIPLRPVTVIDTVGAGDAYMSSLISSIVGRDLASLTEPDLQSMGALASLSAALKCTRTGAKPPTHADLSQADAV